METYKDLESYKSLNERRQTVFDFLVILFKHKNNLITSSNKELSKMIDVPMSSFKKMLTVFEELKLIKRFNLPAVAIPIIDPNRKQEIIVNDDTGYSMANKKAPDVKFLNEYREIRPHPTLIRKGLIK